ncbi:hypothetical protein HY251_18545, partial [bacterium]|nr:hypothetical protein [bacterium]
MSDPGAAGQATARVRSALALARDLAHRPWEPIARDGATRRRFFAIGDPQASAERFFSILDANDLLGGDGRLARDAWLL